VDTFGIAILVAKSSSSSSKDSWKCKLSIKGKSVCEVPLETIDYSSGKPLIDRNAVISALVKMLKHQGVIDVDGFEYTVRLEDRKAKESARERDASFIDVIKNRLEWENDVTESEKVNIEELPVFGTTSHHNENISGSDGEGNSQ